MSAEDSGVPAPKLYLLDIEGTVAPISFVTEKLFPYARAHVERFLSESLESPIGSQEATRRSSRDGVIADVKLLLEENAADAESGAPNITRAVKELLSNELGPLPSSEKVIVGWGLVLPFLVEYFYWLMDRDRKSTALKSLQGKIWKTGFESGELKAALFPDVPPALERWAAQARVAIYSSGSVEAQKLLFSHTTAGDLTPLISGYFDTRTGAKTSSASYSAIAVAMGIAAGEVLFFSDVVRELDSAREAGCGTRLVIRPGNAPVENEHGHESIEILSALIDCRRSP
jgi:enolase-phosphatase E1